MNYVITEDKQSRIVRYSFNRGTYQIVDGVKVFASAQAVKKGNKIIISENYAAVFFNGVPVNGTYVINSQQINGRINFLNCSKL